MLHISGLHGADNRTRTGDKHQPESDQVRKLQKSIHEIIRRIDNHHHKAEQASQIFSSDLVGLRVRLRDYTQKLMHLNPESFGLKYLEMEWKKAWHEPVSIARNVGGSTAKILLEHHLQAGIGQYHHLILSLQFRYGNVEGVKLDWDSNSAYGFSQLKTSGYTHKDTDNSQEEKEKEKKTWLVEILAKCLIWLGDLNRYRLEVLEGIEQKLAETLARKYYSLSASLDPNLGLPYNQLASLSDESNNGMDSGFLYMKCLTSKTKFEGGEANFFRFLGKIKADDSAYSMASHKILEMIGNLLKQEKEEIIMVNCQESLGYLHQLTSDGKVEDSTWLLRSCASVLLTIVKLEGNSGNGVGLCQAWMLAFCSHLTGTLVHTLGTGLYGPTWTEQDISTEDIQDMTNGSVGSKSPMVANGTAINGTNGRSSAAGGTDGEAAGESKEKKKRKKLTDLLRRRKVSNSGSSIESDLSEEELSDSEVIIGKRRGAADNSDGGGESDGDDSESDLNSDEEFFLSDSEDEDYSFDDDKSDVDDDDVVIEEETELTTSEEQELPSTRLLVDLIVQSGLLPAFHLCLIWLRAQPVILSSLQVGLQEEATSFWTRLARMFTLLNIGSNNSDTCSSRYEHDDDIAKMYSTFSNDKSNSKSKMAALDELWCVRGCTMFEDQLKDVDWEQRVSAVDNVKENVARLAYLELWRDWLVSEGPGSSGSLTACPVRWRPDEARAVLVTPAADDADKIDKKCVMKHMAELWLKEEVTNLERSNADQPAILVVDSMALLQDLHMVRRVAGYKKFKMVVPQVVIRELDNIKKQDKNARHSIRWLERELSRGHKGIQAQEAHQKVKVSISPPNRKSPEWSKFCILQCLAYQVELGSDENQDHQVVFLTGDPEIIQKIDEDVTKVTTELNVRVEAISNFMERFLGLSAPNHLHHQQHHARRAHATGNSNWSRGRGNNSRDRGNNSEDGSRDRRPRGWRHQRRSGGDNGESGGRRFGGDRNSRNHRRDGQNGMLHAKRPLREPRTDREKSGDRVTSQGSGGG